MNYLGYGLFATLAATGCGGGSTGNGGTLQITASGEVLALGGYAFPPATADDPAFADGWDMKFTRFIAVLDNIRLSEDPDTSPTDQSKTGKLVAQINGPWAVDMHKGGPLAGKGGTDEQSVAIDVIENQNMNGVWIPS